MKPCYQPTDSTMRASNMHRFMRFLAEREHVSCIDYASLHAYSIAHRSAFWSALCEFAQLIIHQPAETTVKHEDDFLAAEWFPGCYLNYAENLLTGADDRCAIISIMENGATTETTLGDLRVAVAQLANYFYQLGIQPGDRVAAIMPNTSEAVIGFLASAAVGAIWSSCSPDFGTAALDDRLQQISPSILLTCTGYTYKGQLFDINDKLIALIPRLKHLRQIIVAASKQYPNRLTKHIDLPVDSLATCCHGQSASVHYQSLPFAHPLVILFSSGTTGKPKCIVHGAGGTLLQHVKELLLHTDVKPHERLFFYTTCGWMMWNWLVSGLAVQACLVLYDGAATYPEPRCLWRLVTQHQITHFGASARYYSTLAALRFRPQHTVEHLRTLLSTGSPLQPAIFTYLYSHIKADICLASISGGTDIISCFALGCPIRAVHAGQLQCFGLGMAVNVYDANGAPLSLGAGELVCEKPFPSQPIGFWGDTAHQQYKKAYFERFPGVWAQGDFAERTEQDGLIIHGRSDTTLNAGGVRIGTAEIYRQLTYFDAIDDAVVVEQNYPSGNRIVLFVVLRGGQTLSETLISAIKSRIKCEASPRHVPAHIHAVPDIPRTMNGKVSEAAVKAVVNDTKACMHTVLLNPESLVHFQLPN